MRSTQRLQLLLSAGLAGLLLTALPVGFDGSTLGPIPAWADGTHGHGHGHGGGHGNGTANGQANLIVDDESQGSTASSLGALNGAHASDTALAHASPNSRVGRIAAYRDAAATEAAINDALANDDDGIVDATDGTLTQAQIDALDTNGDHVLDQTDVDKAQDESDDALKDAANKDITDGSGNVLTDIRDAVNELLGIN